MAAFAPDVIIQFGPLPITNTLIHTLVVDGLLLGTAYYLSKRITARPKGLQTIIEPIIDGMYSLTESIASNKKSAKAIFPYVMTFFLFIFVANFTGLFPGVGTIGFFSEKAPEHAKIVEKTFASEETPVEGHVEETLPEETHTTAPSEEHAAEEADHAGGFVPLLRGATSDINVTLALAVISVIATHVLSIRLTGWGDYLARWFSLNPINLYVGLLELVAELTKIISLSFRLFGNIFAGEVALHTISALFAFLAPLPFLLLESIVSVVQALVFSILTLVFMSVLTTPHHAHEHEEVSHE
jgi:F-type H+-transporting ATPase subunit a